MAVKASEAKLLAETWYRPLTTGQAEDLESSRTVAKQHIANLEKGRSLHDNVAIIATTIRRYAALLDGRAQEQCLNSIRALANEVKDVSINGSSISVPLPPVVINHQGKDIKLPAMRVVFQGRENIRILSDATPCHPNVDGGYIQGPTYNIIDAMREGDLYNAYYLAYGMLSKYNPAYRVHRPESFVPVVCKCGAETTNPITASGSSGGGEKVCRKCYRTCPSCGRYVTKDSPVYESGCVGCVRICAACNKGTNPYVHSDIGPLCGMCAAYCARCGVAAQRDSTDRKYYAVVGSTHVYCERCSSGMVAVEIDWSDELFQDANVLDGFPDALRSYLNRSRS